MASSYHSSAVSTGYWALNVRSFVDLIDEQQSEGDWHEPGRLMTLRRLVARDTVPHDLPPVFKLPQSRKGAALVTSEFLAAAATHGLSGFNPKPVGSRHAVAAPRSAAKAGQRFRSRAQQCGAVPAASARIAWDVEAAPQRR
jgi:hypothetical protein